jgi:hypothetical protein
MINVVVVIKSTIIDLAKYTLVTVQDDQPVISLYRDTLSYSDAEMYFSNNRNKFQAMGAIIDAVASGQRVVDLTQVVESIEPASMVGPGHR